MTLRLRMSGQHHRILKDHLFPGDGNEAVAVAFCGRRAGAADHVLCVHDVVTIPYESCTIRSPVRVSWPTSLLVPHLEKAMRRGLAVVKFHSHPTEYRSFSDVDDVSDRDLFGSVYGWFDGNAPHGSAVMLPGGELFGRLVTQHGDFLPMKSIAIAGDDLQIWTADGSEEALPAFTYRHSQVFGEGTTRRLRALTAAVVGCSGTGSPLIEQLVRLGIGRLVLVDPAVVKDKNLNRILYATADDAADRRPKVEVLAEAIKRIDLGTDVLPLQKNIVDVEVVRQIAECDVVFGCMDGAEGRNLLNRIATFYCIPYFDVGVRLEADGTGSVAQVCGGVNYLQPGGSSLISRGIINPADIEAEALRRTDPDEYERRFKVGYIRGINEERPAVISVNMQVASMGVNEFLARLHPYRDDPNAGFAWVSTSLTQMQTYCKSDGDPCSRLAKYVGRGDMNPLLDMPILSE